MTHGVRKCSLSCVSQVIVTIMAARLSVTSHLTAFTPSQPVLVCVSGDAGRKHITTLLKFENHRKHVSSGGEKSVLFDVFAPF